MGAPPEYLFPTFLKHATGVLAAFMSSLMLTLNFFFFWFVPLPGGRRPSEIPAPLFAGLLAD